MNNKAYIIILLFFCTSGCKPIKYFSSVKPIKENKYLTVLFDGTSNNPDSKSNIYRLYRNTNKDSTQALYIEGVNGVIGNPFGFGIKKRLEIAYYYIVTNYHKDININLFGFSRGAYTARSFAGLINAAGIVDFSSVKDTVKIKKMVKKLVDVYKDDRTLSDKKSNLSICFNKFRENDSDFSQLTRDMNATINILGLFDTVEASWGKEGFVLNEKMDPCGLKDVYVDQLCNIKNAFQALSLDDTRGQLFTPILLNCDSTIEYCPDKKTNIKEVWFAGSHSQVGGGNLLSSHAYNWMLEEVLNISGILDSTTYESSILDPIENTEEATITGRLLFVRDIKRPLKKFISDSPGQKISIHKSVVDRIKCNQKSILNRWFEEPFFSECYDNKEKKFKDCSKIEVHPKTKVDYNK